MEANKKRNISITERSDSCKKGLPKSIAEKIKFGLLYLAIEMKIFLMGSPLKKGLKSLLPLIAGFLLLANNPLSAQTTEWLWEFSGSNFQITNDLADDFTPSVASNNDISMVVWARKTVSGFDIYGARVTRDGKIMEGDEEGIPISMASNDQMLPSVIWNGDAFFVVWQDRRSGNRWDIYGARVTPDGQVLDPDGIPICIARPNYDQVAPVVSFDGENYLVVWQGKRSPKIWNIYFARVSKEGAVLDKRPVSLTPSFRDQASPSVVYNGNFHMVVWQDKRSNKYWDIYGARISPLGEIVDPEGIRITYSHEVSGDRWKPILSWNGSYYVVIWMVSPEKDRWYLDGKRVGPDGDVFDISDLRILREGQNKAFPAMLWNGEEFLMVWEEDPGRGSKIEGAFLMPGYRFSISEKRLISTQENTKSFLPALSIIENDILIVWREEKWDGTGQIFGQRLSKPQKEL